MKYSSQESENQQLSLQSLLQNSFFLVLCLPRQVLTSNGAIHHDLQLSPSTCCNPLSTSSSVTSFLVFLSSLFPSILTSIIVIIQNLLVKLKNIFLGLRFYFLLYFCDKGDTY